LRFSAIPPKEQVVVRVGPLAAGRYQFIGEFHRDTAKGAPVAVP
jgi:hypothetical protein